MNTERSNRSPIGARQKPCAPFHHKVVDLNDPNFPSGCVCTICGEVFERTIEIRLKGIRFVEEPDELHAKAS